VPKHRRESNLSRLVDGDIIDIDLSPLVVGVVRNRVDASSSIVTVVKVSTGPITAESDVDDKTEVLEGGSDIARVVGPKGDRSSPRARVRVTVLDVLRDLISLESPDGNLCVVPERGENTTSGYVEGMASTSFAVGEGATCVVAARAQALS